jgi:SHS2 domain-containing protein
VKDEPALDAGHRRRPHGTGVTVEAWGPSRGACLDQVVRALVEGFEVGDVPATEPVPVHVEGTDLDLLVGVLEEVVYVIDVLGMLPVDVSLEDTEEGGVAGFFDAVSLERVRTSGALPEAVSRSGLVFEHDGEWHCEAVVEVRPVGDEGSTG